jgi:hypothetical protein
MNFAYSDLGNVLMKFCEKPEYAKDILNGTIYMKESGYFRNLEDTFRGDRNDGIVRVQEEYMKVPVELSGGMCEMQIMTDDVYGLPNGDKIPVFCATLLDEIIIDPISSSSGVFCEEFRKEILQFGRYAVLIPVREFLDKSDAYMSKTGFGSRFGKVTYLNFSDVYADSTASYGDSIGFRVKQFLEICDKHSCGAINDDFLETSELFMFQKNTSYRWQNEWRFVLKSEEGDVIPTEKDYHVMSIGRLEGARIFEIESILNATIDLTC